MSKFLHKSDNDNDYEITDDIKAIAISGAITNSSGKLKFVSARVENIEGTGENAGFFFKNIKGCSKCLREKINHFLHIYSF